jgi:hypothetical protein
MGSLRLTSLLTKVQSGRSQCLSWVEDVIVDTYAGQTNE